MRGGLAAAVVAAGLAAAAPAGSLAPPPSALGPPSSLYAALGRFAAPATVLAAPDTVAGHAYLEAMRHYARGEAALRLGRPADARAEAALVVAPVAAVAPASRNGTVLRLARLTLQGDAALEEHHADAAITAFRGAADLQDARLAKSLDPPAWWYPARRSLAAALLAKGDAAGAEREATAVLAVWRLDPVTLAIRAQARHALGHPGAAADLAAARRGWHGDVGELKAAAAA